MAESQKILPHTADIKIQLTADTLSGLFHVGLNSLNQLLLADPDYPKDQEPTVVEHLDLKSVDATSLLIDFLSEVLTLSQIHKVVFFDFQAEKLTENRLQATIRGTPVASFNEDIKAVTYHEAEIRLNSRNEWETNIVFDI